MRAKLFLLLAQGLLLLSVSSCGDQVEEVEYFGKFDMVNDFDKADGMGSAAVPTSADDSDTAVWEVWNDWADTDTPDARKAGLAWEANSGLNWNEKFALWIESLPKIDAYEENYKTFTITNPQGKTIQAPVLECAETAYFLRATFASWYHLPFFLEAVDSDGTRVFMGHFGWRTARGRYKNSNLFRKWYRDYSGGDYDASNWPRDERLRAKKLYGADDDYQPFLGDGARAGTYFDELFLNKRVGHFLILLLSNFGSIHLADSANTFNLKPEALRQGDLLLERWQRRGIGHTLVVKHVEPGQNPGTLMAELVSGSMPRRQPKWEDPTASKRYFTSNMTGGEGTNWSGERYAELGGGLKRWRVARAQDGWWVNTILPEDLDYWISSTDYDAIAARPSQFEELLDKLDPEAARDALLAIIEDKRNHLRSHPASCSARIAREEAFRDLYDLMEEHFGMSKLEVDKQYRILDDYVFAELVYNQSKTCCWNSTTAAMYEIIMDYERNLQQQSEGCTEPVVFMNDGGYDVFYQHAVEMGRENEWVDWSEDESCPQREVARDTEAEHLWSPFCEVFGAPAGCQPDRFEPNNTRDDAAAIMSGDYDGLSICGGEDDWYWLSPSAGTLRISIYFEHSKGDLDIKLLDEQGQVVDSSAGTGDSETVEAQASGDENFFLRVYGYNGAENTYRMTVSY
ncbi:MAG: hypothetical protein D6806_06890 [Deltaproteobacteria bacterium]|nr:MAG: hypothetical protein D6806_06890 [Deltaproteobacteria bacterium]